MSNIIIENLVQIAATLLITLIGVLGAWLSNLLAKRAELHNVAAATNEVVAAAQQTVLELQQTFVDDWKSAHTDGKLTNDEISALGRMLIEGTSAKMSDASKNLLNAAGVDISAIIKGAGEAMVRNMKT